jgi:hypothetical protein
MTKYIVAGRRDFYGANLTDADLTRANLTRANLTDADLTRANLTGTCLDPEAVIPPQDLSGWEQDTEYVYGWRTRRSVYYGSHIYAVGAHRAPYFSVSSETECHPGIYGCPTREEAERISPDVVRYRARKSDTLCVGAKWRHRAIEVL